jgi:hypothetical protein
VPVSVDVCGLFSALSDTCNVPVNVPVWVGVNTTSIVQVPRAATLVPQVVVDTLKSPVAEMTMLVRATFRWLVSVNTFALLVAPTIVPVNVTLAGVIAAGAPPVPDSGTVCGLFAALSLIVSVPVSAPIKVGAKVTLIWQFFPAARVLPQGFELVARAKSPLVVMLLILSAALPLLVSVTVFAALVSPRTILLNAREVGDSVTAGPEPLEFTVRLSKVVFDKLPDTPLMVNETVPVVAEALAVSVNKAVEVAGFGLNPAVTPLGKPEALSVTLPLKLFKGLTVMVLVPLLPWVVVTLVGEAESVKFGSGGPARSLIREGPIGLPQPVARSKPATAG